MNLKDYSGLDDFDDGELRKAARFVTQAMVDAVPPSSECKHVFSPTFQAKMARLIAREKWMDVRQRWAKRIAIALLTLIVGVASWLSIDVAAREAFIHWVREVYENSIIYRFLMIVPKLFRIFQSIVPLGFRRDTGNCLSVAIIPLRQLFIKKGKMQPRRLFLITVYTPAIHKLS